MQHKRKKIKNEYLQKILHLYRFGTGFFFNGIPRIVLAPADIAIILLLGVVTALILSLVCNKKKLSVKGE